MLPIAVSPPPKWMRGLIFQKKGRKGGGGKGRGGGAGFFKF